MIRFRLATCYSVRISISLLLLSAGLCRAQRDPSAYKSAEVSAFGGYLNAGPDVGPFRDNGVSVGLDYTRFLHFPVAPSIEARANLANGSAASEKTYLIGLRGEGVLKQRFHPYGDFLAGKGTVHYQPGFLAQGYILGDASLVFSYGGGVNVDVARSWQVKIDFQGQRWRPGAYTYYHPTALLFGVTYRVPFKRYNAPRSLY